MKELAECVDINSGIPQSPKLEVIVVFSTGCPSDLFVEILYVQLLYYGKIERKPEPL